MRCLVLAGGTGSRFATRGGLKPLATVAGLSLLERAIVTAHVAGVDEFFVVCGHDSSKLVAHLEVIARRRSLVIHPVLNADYNDGNGLSVLAGRDCLAGEERFGLVMADHVFEAALLASLFSQTPAPGEVVLAVDSDLSNPAVDPDDVTRVEVSAGRVRAIAKRSERYNGFDTGAFVCTPAVFEAVAESVANGDTSLSGGMRLLAADGRLQAHDVTGKGWVDVDTPSDQRHATRWLYGRLRKPHDGFVSRRLNRPLSLGVLTPVLLRAWPRVTANQVSLLAFVAGAIAGLLFATGEPVVAALFVHLSSVLDGSDGEVARLKMLESGFGGYLDAVLDRLADSVMLLGVLVYLLESSSLLTVIGVRYQPTVVAAIAGAALVGTLMVSYTSTKASVEVGHHYTGPLVGAGRGRDLRLLILTVGGLLSGFNPTFLLGAVTVIAFLTLAVVGWRIVWSWAATRVRRPTDLGAVRVVVFDFDGTVADTMAMLSDVAVAFLTETYGMSAQAASRAYRDTSGMAFAEQLEAMVPGDPRNAEMASRFEIAKNDLACRFRPFAETLDVLADLGLLNIALFICSSTTDEIVTRCCRDSGMSDLVQGVTGLTPGNTKLDQLHNVVTTTGLDPAQLLFVGDSLYDAKLAKQTRIGFVGITRLFTGEEFSRIGVPCVADLSELRAHIAAAHARRDLMNQSAPAPNTPSAPAVEP